MGWTKDSANEANQPKWRKVIAESRSKARSRGEPKRGLGQDDVGGCEPMIARLERIKAALGRDCTPEMRIAELGLDSLEFLDLAVSLGIENKPLGSVQTIADLAALL
jgi:hypothetical protein